VNSFFSLHPITKRALAIPYVSPLICELAENASGSGSSSVDVLNILPTFQEAGPTLSAALTDAGTVQLSWSAVENAFSYVIYRSASPEGPFSVRASGVIGQIFIDNPGSGTFFYKVTGLEPNFGETTASNLVSVTVP